MPQPVTLEMAAEVVAAFVSNNPLPRGELPALIQAIHDTLARLSAGVENSTSKEEPEGAGRLNPEVADAGIFDLLGRRQTFQVAETAFGGARPDAGAVSREMEASLRLSHGCRQLRGESIGDGESDWSWAVARKRRSAQTRTPASVNADARQRPFKTNPHRRRSAIGQTRQRAAPMSSPFSDPHVRQENSPAFQFHGLTPRLLSPHTCVPLGEGARMTNTAGIAGDRICSFVERVERIDEEIKALNEGKKEVFAEAKGEGFDVKVLREILRLRKQDKDERDEQESLLDLYLRAMESSSSQAKAA